MADLKGDKDALIAAVHDWSEGSPCNPADARLMQALWRYNGDNTEPCDGCDGDCGEPCAPCTAEAAIADLENWIKDYNRRHGITVLSEGDFAPLSS